MGGSDKPAAAPGGDAAPGGVNHEGIGSAARDGAPDLIERPDPEPVHDAAENVV